MTANGMPTGLRSGPSTRTPGIRSGRSTHTRRCFLLRQAIGEASPAYLVRVPAADRIRWRLPGVKLIAQLRDPSERAYASYLGVDAGGERRNFATVKPTLATELRRELVALYRADVSVLQDLIRRAPWLT